MKTLRSFIVFASLFLAYSVSAVDLTSILGPWHLNSLKCKSTGQTYPAKGWSLLVDKKYFSSKIQALCEIHYSLEYKVTSNQIQLASGSIFKQCRNEPTTITQSEKKSLNYEISLGSLYLETENSFCKGLAIYQFVRD